MREQPNNQKPAQLSRRSFLRAAAAAACAPALAVPACSPGADKESPAPGKLEPSEYDYGEWDRIFRTIAAGFVSNALRTSDTFAVCDYRSGTMLDNFVTAQGKTCDSVTRILPALAARLVSPDGGRPVEAEGRSYDLEEILVSALVNATDPAGKDFWLYPPGDEWDQRQVESSIVAWSLWLAADRLMERLTAGQRRNIQDWLASCTVQQVRRNNWALFTAVNHAARLALSERWPEFSGDPGFFRADLEAIDSMYQGDGWYHDSLDGQDYDYYNFWVFASHNLYWDAMVGGRFPELREKFRPRLKAFLETVPFLFGGNGSHVLFGRSLIYRWATLTPLVLAYRLGLWPHSTGLLRRICNRSLQFLWESGAWDPENGKLRETLTPHSSRAVCEGYINNGHPYWGMQAFYAMSFPRDDPFWSVEEEPLPVERGDFRRVIAAPGILVHGTRRTGQVQVLQANCTKSYRNKYYNFSYSSHFPANVEMVDDLVAPDCSLSFESEAGAYARRDTPYRGKIISDRQAAWQWSATVGEIEMQVASMAYLEGELQWRAHRLSFDSDTGLTAVESTYALGLGPGEDPETLSGDTWVWGRAPGSGCAVFVRAVVGFDRVRKFSGFRGREDLNLFYPRAVQAGVAAGLEPGSRVLAAAFYASPRPLPLEEVLARTEKIPEAVEEFVVSGDK
ncbi:MAG: DUF2264 domain-containing protein [Candidatus Glassbacteria bacterium]|nr:DUF2264 domain-containing protein [Candidatus Glassbacteria bacterium]